jgi:hypothetical protein
MDDASKAAASAAVGRRLRLDDARLCGDLALGGGAGLGGASLGRGFSRIPLGCLMAGALDVRFGRQREKDHARP